MSLAYLGAVSPGPQQATYAVATLQEYTNRLASMTPQYSGYRVMPQGYSDPNGNTGTFLSDARAMTLQFTWSVVQPVRDAWAQLVAYAAAHGVTWPADLPSDVQTIAFALPDLRAAVSAAQSMVRVDFEELDKAQGDSIGVTRGPTGAYVFPVQHITSKPPSVAAAGMGTGAKALMGAAGLGLLWLAFASRRKKKA